MSISPAHSISGVSHSRRLREKIDFARVSLDAAAFALWNHPRLPELYPEFLFRNHAVIRASVPLMQAAADVCESRKSSDPLSAGMFEYLSHHIPEEMHHDDWVLEDLEVLGFDRKKVMARVPPPSVARLVGSQYYWIRHVHPVALLGFIAVLEGTPPDVNFFEQTADRAQLPRSAFSNLLRHGKLDPRHRDDLDHALDGFPLSENDHSLLGVSAFETIHLLAVVVQEALDMFPALARAAAVPLP